MDLDYPFIFGTDVAGTVVQLGSSVKKFNIGQRVIGHCDGYLTQKKTNAGFQLYSTCREILVAAVPDSLPLANAGVLPLSVSTASAGLFCNLKMQLPSLDSKPTGKRVLIWGGSSSVGSSAIQLAAAAGYEVLTTASKANFEYVKSLGASQVFDYGNTDVVDQILNVLQKGDYVYDCIAHEQTQVACGKILSAIGGGHLPLTLPPMVKLPENVDAAFGMSMSLRNF